MQIRNLFTKNFIDLELCTVVHEINIYRKKVAKTITLVQDIVLFIYL